MNGGVLRNPHDAVPRQERPERFDLLTRYADQLVGRRMPALGATPCGVRVRMDLRCDPGEGVLCRVQLALGDVEQALGRHIESLVEP